MTVYCDDFDCDNNNYGKCANVSVIGEKAVWLQKTYTGLLKCTDFAEKEEVEEE